MNNNNNSNNNSSSSSSSNSNATSKLTLQQLNKMTESEVLATINTQYFNVPNDTSPSSSSKQEFDSLRAFLEQDNEELTLEYLETEHKRHEIALKHINQQLAKIVIENYTAFVQGMTKVQEIGTDLTKTSVLCRNGRNRLQQAQENVVKGGLSVLSKYRQRKSFLNLMHYLTKIKDFMEKEKELQQLIEERDFPSAIQLALQHKAAIATYREIYALKPLEANAKEIYDNLSKKVEDSFVSVLGSFNPINYERVLIACKLLEMPVKNYTNHIKTFYIKAIDTMLQNVAMPFALKNTKAKSRPEEIFKMKFGELIRQVSSDDLLPFLLQSLYELSDLMLNYYEIYEWHMSSERNGESSSQYDFTEVKNFVNQFRCELWDHLQNKYSHFLNNADFGHLKLERFLQVSHALNMFCELGEEFSEKDSHQLRGSLKAKSQGYFLKYHRDTLENIRSMMENESWQRMDPSCFSLNDIIEFDQSYGHRKTISDWVEEHIKQVRMLLHSEDSTQNPFKIAFDKGFFQIENEKTENKQQTNHYSDSESDDDVASDESDGVEERATSAQEQQRKRQLEKKKQGPVFTNISMHILRRMGEYVHAMEVLRLINLDIFNAFTSFYKFYIYTVYSIFADVSDTHTAAQQMDANILLPENDVNIPDSLREIFREIRQVLNAYNNEKFFNGARSSQLLNVQLKSQKAHYGFYERAVATESLTFMQNAIKKICQERLTCLIPKTKLPLIDQFIQQMNTTIEKVSSIIYERVGKVLFGHKYDDKIDKKWTPTQVNRESSYITSIIRDLEDFKDVMESLENNENIPAGSTTKLWTVVLKGIMENIVDGYSKIKALNHQGIAQMQLDLKTLTIGIERTVPQTLRITAKGSQRKEVPYLYLVRSYIEGFYNTPDYMIEWVQENKDNYTLAQALNIVQIAPEMQNLKRKDKSDLIAKIEQMYRGTSSAMTINAPVPSTPAPTLEIQATTKTNTSNVASTPEPPSQKDTSSININIPSQPQNTAHSTANALKKTTGSMWDKGIGFLKRDTFSSDSLAALANAGHQSDGAKPRASIDGNRKSMDENRDEQASKKPASSMWNLSGGMGSIFKRNTNATTNSATTPTNPTNK